MNENDITVGMRVSLTKDQLKVKQGEGGVVSAKRRVNDNTMFEVIFDNGLKLFCKADSLDQEGMTRQEILSIKAKPRSQGERAIYLARKVIENKKISNRLDRLDQSEKELKAQLQSIVKERVALKTAARKIEEASRRLTKIKALSDNVIVVQIEEDITI
jgi:hypothetical protein